MTLKEIITIESTVDCFWFAGINFVLLLYILKICPIEGEAPDLRTAKTYCGATLELWNTSL